MSKKVAIPDLAGFYAAFGNLGLKVGPRTGAGRRTQDDKEWYVARHFLKRAIRARLLKPPFAVRKAGPPEPDFVLEFNNGKVMAWMEITEATDPADQREMTEFERSKGSAMLLGEFGGRFADGASQPGRAWASDVLDAMKRKQGKTICSKADTPRHLVIYPNSNASSLLFSDRDELDAFRFLNELLVPEHVSYVQAANGCLIHILGKERVCFDLLGKNRLVKRVPRNYRPKPQKQVLS
jgi:hypothetical protein